MPKKSTPPDDTTISTTDDMEALYEIYQRSFMSLGARLWTKSEIESLLAQNHITAYILKPRDASIVAFAIIANMVEHYEILTIGTHPEYQHQGHASTLLEQVIAKATKNNINVLFLEVDATNRPAHRFYRKHLFDVIATRKNYYANNNDALIMKRIC